MFLDSLTVRFMMVLSVTVIPPQHPVLLIMTENCEGYSFLFVCKYIFLKYCYPALLLTL